ncbi:MAG TPA: AMP-binding protein [Bacteroidales bacterium]|nr:AMP-binding protein [Bacteroidales bacterium]
MGDSDIKLTIPGLFYRTLKRVPDSGALAFAGEKPLSYTETSDKIQALIAFLEKNGTSPGDKLAILSTNMPNWALAYYAITFMGAVVVPILPDFSPTEVNNVISHSGATKLFISSSLLYKVENLQTEVPVQMIILDNFSGAEGTNISTPFSDVARPEKVYRVNEDDLASVIYTSGTTGRSKGVMLSHRNISFTALKGSTIHHLDESDRFISVLPLSHTYENTLGLILPMLCGSCIYYLKKPPTPSVLLPALEEVRPTAMLTVPLIIEKIYYSRILPAFNGKFLLRLLYRIPPFRKLLNRAAGKKLMRTFGGEIKFFGIGGAKLSRTVEKFLAEAKFPYAIGYGLTETSPLLAGSGPANTVLESTGPVLEGVELMIHNPDRVTGEGEIWARGPNVMLGYYCEPELTAEVITPDGWFRTGDLGVFDKNNNLFIRGRLKNMIVGASGENIYPEEIESVINNFRHVAESLVIQQKGKLVAFVHLNMEELEKKYHLLKDEASKKYDEKVDELLRELQEYVNSRVNKFSQINKVVLQPVPFQKTATQKIKRFLYT